MFVSVGRVPLFIISVVFCAVTVVQTASQVSQGGDVVERLLAEGVRLENNDDLDGALQQYTLLLERFPESVLVPEVLLRIAQGRWRSGDMEGALESAAQLRENFATTASAAGGIVLEGQIQTEQAQSLSDLETAQATFNRVSLLFSGAPPLDWRGHALVEEGAVGVLLGRMDAAARSFLAAIEDEKPFAGTAKAQIGLAGVFIDQKQWVPAAEILQRVIENTDHLDLNENVNGQEAKHLLSLIHRTLLRPSIGVEPWTNVRQLPVTGARLREPVAVDAKDDQELVFAQDDGPFAAVLDPDGQLIKGQRINDLRATWWDSKSDPYALTEREVFNPLSGERYTFQIPTDEPGETETLEALEAGARGLFGHWFVIDTDPRRVLMFTPDGQYQSTLIERIDNPRDLAIDSRGRLFILNERAGVVMRFTAEGVREKPVVSGGAWERPEALAVDGVGNLYILDVDAKTIDIYTSDGTVVTTIGPVLFNGVELDDPRDIAVDSTGRLFIADRGLDAILVLE